MTSRFEVASRANVPPFHVMDLLAAAHQRQRTHGDLVNFVAGQPMTGAPAPVTAEAIRLLQSDDPLGYTVADGIPELRERIAEHHRKAHGIDVSADDVIVTTGSSGGFLLAFLAAFEAGDRVAMARPGYACYRNVLVALGCEVVEIPCGPETRFQPTVAQLEDLGRHQGSGRRQPRQPDRHHAAPRRARRHRRLVRGARRPADLRRDLPRHRVRPARRRRRRCHARPGRRPARPSCSRRSPSTSP